MITKYNFCPICNAKYNLWGVKNNDNIDYTLVKCIKCSFAFVNPRPSLEWLKNWYAVSGHHSNEEKKSLNITFEQVLKNEISHPNSTLDAERIFWNLDKIISKNSNLTLLDVGCGYGFFSKKAIEKKYHVVPIELAELEKNIATKLLGIEPVSSTFEDFVPQKRDLFDVILMSQILEHAYDINAWIIKANNLSNNGGILVIALPNFNSFLRYILKLKEPYIIPPAHLNYFSKKNLSILLEKHGFEIIRIHSISRISSNVLKSRIPKKFSFLIKVFSKGINFALFFFDLFGFGMILNVYAKKIR